MIMTFTIMWLYDNDDDNVVVDDDDDENYGNDNEIDNDVIIW